MTTATAWRDGSDNNPLVRTSCADLDADQCDDCALGLAPGH